MTCFNKFVVVYQVGVVHGVVQRAQFAWCPKIAIRYINLLLATKTFDQPLYSLFLGVD